ncbi:SDR family oxidoreductase [Enterovibrio sp. ZSDZ35]|uniref:SDR family oxidoreductase n=1 Tax=Enterovibrio qingdaonensis TaxID=2899818 RepID=A0ABT5QQC3_9GAMM|nr:SDR family oxidoreductase [Enterovibrio sp. ZSDZ35]MDD1783172.1 SDR family oxidoreductase [Enterovibrio sp. ZSDZ35]
MKVQERFSLKPGLRVLITAGASGIGRAMAERFSDSGAKVHICDISDEALHRVQNERPEFGVTRCDVSDSAQIKQLFDEAIQHLGGLDVLINNAGIAGPTAAIEDIDEEQWHQTIDINLNSQYHCTRLAAPILKQQGDGVIINISSQAGRFGFANRTPYAAAKWGIVGLTASLAKELGPDGIRVNSILPGIVEGPRIEGVIRARAELTGATYEETKQQSLNQISLRRMVSAEDIADMALFLCMPAGSNISGQSISVCGNVETL